MRLPRFRFTIRRMMLAMALIGVLALLVRDGLRRLSYRDAVERRSSYRDAVERCTEFAAGYDSTYDFNDGGFTTCYGERWDGYAERVVLPDLRSHSADRAYRAAKSADYRRLAEKYQRAADRPWLHVAPDPPEPK